MFCPNCGKQIHDSAAMCEYCGYEMAVYQEKAAVMPQQPVVQPVMQPAEPAVSAPTPNAGGYTIPQQPAYYAPPVVQTPQKRENVVTGIVGALVGAAIGGGSIILFSQLGLVSALSGLLLAVCTLKGYELLGGKLSITGLIVSVILMAVTPYFADRLDWAILVMNELGLGLGEAFNAIPQMLGEGYSVRYYAYTIEPELYTSNLLTLYFFVLLGAVSTVITAFKRKR